MAKAAERAFLERFELGPPLGFQQAGAGPASPLTREDVMAAVRQDGWALQHAPVNLQADRDVVLAAVDQDGWALQFAAPELHDDRDVVLRAARKDGWVLSLASAAVRADKEVVLAAVGQDWQVLRIVPASLRADREVVLKAVLQEGWALEFASAALQADRDVVLAAVKRTGEALRYARQFCGDYEVALAAAQNCGLVLALLEPEVQDLPLVLAAIRQDTRAMDFVEPRLHDSVQEALGFQYCPWSSKGAAVPDGPDATLPPLRLADPSLRPHLEQLGLPVTASAEEIRQCFRKLALRYHPDKNSEEDVAKATEAFQRINRAYAALKELLGGGSLLFFTGLLVARRFFAKARPPPPAYIALSAALQLLRQSKVQELLYSEGGLLTLHMKEGSKFLAQLVPGSEAKVFDVADQALVSLRHVAPAKGASQVLSVLLPLIFLFVWYQIAKSLITRDNKWTPTRSRLPRERTTFADVVSRSKVELSEIVDYLNHPAKFKQAGARMPRGALLVGPSGTGKTLLARAVAGEANCSFLSASASEFVEVYVGRGASRVRDLFKQARSMAPVVLFLDELDALGTRSRGHGGLGGSEEYVQTLNQILTELDGFHGHSDGIVVLGATNRQEAIDPALLRPGRFDRFIQVELPDEEERRAILRIHVRKADENLSVEASTLNSIASSSAGFSGAELANVVNEAIFLALRDKRSQPAAKDFSDALDRRKVARRAVGCGNGALNGDTSGLGGFRMPRPWPKAAAA